MRSGDLVVCDLFSHASIVDGARLSGAETRFFQHNKVAHLEVVLRSATPGRVLVVAAGVYSADGFAINSHRWFNLTFAAVYTGLRAGPSSTRCVMPANAYGSRARHRSVTPQEFSSWRLRWKSRSLPPGPRCGRRPWT
jgi:hypothetical protein